MPQGGAGAVSGYESLIMGSLGRSHTEEGTEVESHGRLRYVGDIKKNTLGVSLLGTS